MVAHINTRMMIFGDCVQTVRRRCRQFRNKCFGYNFSHVNSGSADCTAFRAACRKSTVVIAEAVVPVPRVDVQDVDKEGSSSHGGDRCNCGIDHKIAISGALLNKVCTTTSLRSRSRMSKVVVEVVQLIPRADVPVVL